VQAAGLNLLRPTSRAVWGENAAQNQLYSFYCIAERNVVTIIGTAARFEDADATVTRLRDAFRSGTAAGGGTAPAPTGPKK
jgi:hypothetical protein